MIEPSIPCAPPVTAISGAADLDPAALARLRELDPDGKAALVSRVLSAYVGSLTSLRDEWRRARADGQPEVLRRVAHTLKSSSASIGATHFVSLCARVEAAVRAGEGSGLERMLQDLEAESHRVECAVRIMLTN